MSVEIPQDAVRKLTHESLEIRVRALDQIETKFIRALAHQLDIDLNAVDLCKQLIRWFSFKPLQTPERVLHLLKRLLASSKHGSVAIETIGIDRLKHELQKLKRLLQNNAGELKNLDSLLNLLIEKETQLSHFKDAAAESDIVEIVQKLSIQSSNEETTEQQQLQQMYAQHDCEYVWSRPTTADYNSLKFLSNVLTNRQQHNTDELNNALQHLQITMSDYPAEYMLQSPHIFWNLLKLFEEPELDNSSLSYTITALSTFLCILKERLLQRRKVDNFSMPAKPQSGTHCSSSQHIGLGRSSSTKSQLKVEKALELLLEKFLAHLSMHTLSMRSDILHIMKATAMILDILHLQKLSLSSKILLLAFQMRQQLQNDYFQDDSHLNLARARFLWLTFVLHEMAELNANCSHLLGQHRLLESVICDYSLQKSFPKRFKQIKSLLLRADAKLEHAYEPLERWKLSIELAIALLKKDDLSGSNKTNRTPAFLLNKAVDIVATLDTLNSLKLVKIIFNAIIECIPTYLTKCELKDKAINLLCQLLNLKQFTLRAYVYQHVSFAVKKHFAALMNGECYCIGIQNRALLSALIIGVPMDTHFLEEIIQACNHQESESNDKNNEIREYASDTLLLLLRARRFYESSWETFLEMLVPVFPLIQCLQNTNTNTINEPLREAVLKLLDPDAAQVPFITLLRGNIGLLFTTVAEVRCEALTRLIYTLNLLPESTAYIPNIMEISDILPNDLCVLQTPRKFRHVFAATETYYESTTLHNLLTLLDTADIEPGVRKSTLMQLNVMLKNWELTAAFCELEAHCLLLRVLENALQKASSIDYIESIVPVVSMLAKLLIYDGNFRQELCIIPNVYVLLLRALFYFSEDLQVRQDVSICLFLLHFGGYVVVPRGGGEFVAPILFRNLNCPLVFEFKENTAHSKTVAEDPHRNFVRNVFASELQWTAYMRQLIADAYFEAPLLNKCDVERLHVALDICPTYLLLPHDVRLAKATDTMQSIRTLLRTISNATDEKTLVKATNFLQFQLILFCMENRGEAQLPLDVANGIFTALSKYLQVTPGNVTDFEVYACVLNLFHFCVRQPLLPIGKNLLHILRNDFHHGMIVMLQNAELPTDFMSKLSYFLADLFAFSSKNTSSSSSSSSASSENKRLRDEALRSNLFELLHNLILQYFTSRELQKVRCMQRVMCVLATSTIMLPINQIFEIRKSLLRLSIGIRSTTQTGSQWHRNVLTIYAQLFNQLSDELKSNVSGNTLKHLIGLAGHNDTTVRALAWLCLSQIAGLEGLQQRLQRTAEGATETKTTTIMTTTTSGALLLAQKIQHLPGGLIGCCLSTFLDSSEIPIVRHYAGSIFVALLHETCTFEQALKLLEQHAFFNCAYTSLENCIFDKFFELDSPYLLAATSSASASYDDCESPHVEGAPCKFVTCDLIGCYCRICFELIHKNPNYVEELCEKPLLFKLYELLKLPNAKASKDNPSYFDMCAQICQLYAGCAKRNLVFLQRTLCHDERWLLCFFQLLRPPTTTPDACVVYVLQLLLALSREDFVYEKLCNHLADNPSIVQQLFQRALNVSKANRSLQSCALSLMIFLLLKSQQETTISTTELSQTVVGFVDDHEEKRVSNFKQVIEATVFVVPKTTNKRTTTTADKSEENKENNKTFLHHNHNTKKMKPSKCVQKQQQQHQEDHHIKVEEELEELTIAEVLMLDLNRLFCHFYPSNICKFEVNPSNAKVQICESLSVLLKSSPYACKAATQLKLLDNILHILTIFVQDSNAACCSTFVRRYGEAKKLAVVRNLQVLFQVLLNWFAPSPNGAVLTDELQCLDLSKVIIQIWPWLAHSAELRELVIKLLAFLSERSLLLCRQFSTLISSYTHSILQLAIKMAISETQKLKTSNASAVHVPVVILALRVMINCSACSEGRFTLVKEHALDVFDGLYPLNLKTPKIRVDILQNWLQFWELFSRYNEGGQARNINGLCDVIKRTAPCSPIRLLCLKILRNMCFVPNNRTTFIASAHFIYTIDEIITQPISSSSSSSPTAHNAITSTSFIPYEEQFIVCVSLWQIIAGGVKYVAKIRGTKLVSKMRILRDKLSITSEETAAATANDVTFRTDLANVLDIIFAIFDD